MKKSRLNKTTIFTIAIFILTGLLIAFIWTRSTLTAEASTGESMYVLEMLMNFLKALGLSAELTDHIIRKSAHFCEFALLGCLTLWCGYRVNKSVVKDLMPAGFVCLFTAVIDEYIQLFSTGRSAEIKDVILDFTGSVSGAVFFILIIIIILLIKKVRRKK